MLVIGRWQHVPAGVFSLVLLPPSSGPSRDGVHEGDGVFSSATYEERAREQQRLMNGTTQYSLLSNVT